MNKSVRSPLFYVGDKYKLMKQLNELFPKEINNFYDVFCGGGSVSLNVKANKYHLNDLDNNIIKLHEFLINCSKDINETIDIFYDLIESYGLSLSEKGLNKELLSLKKKYKKTYFSRYNKKGYLKLRKDYNQDKSKTELLYLLLVYGFNHMIRFNNNGEFNLPVGNVDWNKNVTRSLLNYSLWANNHNIVFSSGMDFDKYVNLTIPKENDFYYFDPPYLITCSDYNKLWNIGEEKRLYYLLDKLNDMNVKWGLSNMVFHKGRKNDYLLSWSKKYNVHIIQSNYISRFDNTIKKDSMEVFITNYG